MSFEEMAEVGTREIITCIAGTVFVKGLFVLSIFCVFYDYFSLAGKESSVSSVSCGEDTIKKIYPSFNGLQDITDVTHAHEIPRPVFWKERIGFF